MNLVLKKLGIQSEPNSNHNTHFHLDIAAPTIVPLPHNLLADTTAPNAAQVEAVRAAAQTIAEGAQSNFGFTQGDLNMLFMDMPNVPPQYTPVIVAQASQARQQGIERTLGVCHPIENKEESRLSAINGMGPVMNAMTYLEKFEHQKFDQTTFLSVYNNAKMTLLQAPRHGELMLSDSTQGARYLSNDYSYEGTDSATVLVEVGGYKVKVIYHFVLMQNVPGSSDQGTATDNKQICPKGNMWKVSTAQDASGNLVVNSVDYLPVDPGTTDTLTSPSLSNWFTLTQVDAKVADMSSLLTSLNVGASSGAGITVNVADLAGGAVGQTTGNAITLDTNAAGNGWFIDTTPADNSEFLPTADPGVWKAKAGSAAAGKMDMLSVLLHEYGHALGIEHSANPYDFMGTTLQAGERRLPTADELALMQQLVGQLKNGLASATDSTLSPSPSPASGRGWPAGSGEGAPGNSPIPLDLPLGGSLLGMAGFMAGRRSQYEVAANPTFATLGNNGWNTQGSVDINNGTATLNEVSTSQTRLNQVFMLGANDHYLTFTLAGSALDNAKGAPHDAFEVALLDASTGASLLGNDGLTRSDAFLNLQADGTQNAASCVNCINNADGSRTYRVDLSNVPKGIAVNLSFDLLGFGAANSHITLRDIRASGLPQLRDATASVAEDNLLTFNPYAQADGVVTANVTPSIVDAPAHGSIAVNADGTFSYTPALNYFGTDSFTYRLSDGAVNSNLATVSLTITAVNDAPVAADVQATTAEDTPLVIAL